ncbi:MAG: rRNA large subunit methyltransferase I [Verrucomicrobia bacterium]|nr:MAG: rRNA large subunit methyltransferase I [Verrucomicrobiota bacterium]
MAGIIVRPHSRILHGHDWVYGSEVTKVYGQPQNGDVISIKDGRDRFLGSAIYNSQSAIVARRFSHRRQALNLDFLIRRLRHAEAVRQPLFGPNRPCRLVWSESDGLPGLIIDRFGEVLVCQIQTYALELEKELLWEAVRQVFGFKGLVFRGDSSARIKEGLSAHEPVIYGEVPTEVLIEVAGIQFSVDVLTGQKTGFYLDQVANYQKVSAYASERKVLDCFANQGGFALSCARAGARAVTAVESGSASLKRLRENARRNQMEMESIEADVFDFLKGEERRKSQYDLIILDPPSFTKVRSRIHDALRGYQELHLRAAKLLSKGGILATFSCSHHISSEALLETVRTAFHQARRSVRLRERLAQGLDHPILLHLPETEYLKGMLIEEVASF